MKIDNQWAPFERPRSCLAKTSVGCFGPFVGFPNTVKYDALCAWVILGLSKAITGNPGVILGRFGAIIGCFGPYGLPGPSGSAPKIGEATCSHAPSGPLWFHLAPSGYLWFPLVLSGSLWFPLVPSGSPGSVWLPLVLSGSLWFLLSRIRRAAVGARC